MALLPSEKACTSIPQANPDFRSNIQSKVFIGREKRKVIGADGETRTPTPVKALAPEASVSTNSTTSAKWGALYRYAFKL